MQMTDEHWYNIAKKGDPSPGFEPTPLERSKKVMNFCLKLYHWAMGASTERSTEYFGMNEKNRESITHTCILLK